jgi:hypothetical protein
MGESRCDLLIDPHLQTLKSGRQELLHWLNSLLQLNITKVEQCGTGFDLPIIQLLYNPLTISSAVYCQIFDSIYRRCPPNHFCILRPWRLTQSPVDVPMARVKFNVNNEYAYIQNFKILQSKTAFALQAASQGRLTILRYFRKAQHRANRARGIPDQMQDAGQS